MPLPADAAMDKVWEVKDPDALMRDQMLSVLSVVPMFLAWPALEASDARFLAVAWYVFPAEFYVKTLGTLRRSLDERGMMIVPGLLTRLLGAIGR
jgi:hypothetical protein